MTSNPAIFEKAIAGSTDYAQALGELEKRTDLDAKGIYEQLAIRDIQDAADALRPVYDQTKRRDGYVSLEVSPYLAHKTQETIEEARRLWKAVGRENLMIKIPGTPEGIPAFQQLISEGINVNVTLLFAQDVYERVAAAYIAGLEDFAKSGGDVSRMASVASFFVSRIDSLVDTLIDERIKTQGAADKATGNALAGQSRYRQRQARVPELQADFRRRRAGRPSRSAARRRSACCGPAPAQKIPRISDVLYVEELIGPDTVNTIPPATYDAFRDHGHPRASLEEDVEGRAPDHGRPRQSRHLHEGGHRPAHRRRRKAFRGSFRQAARRGQQARQKGCALGRKEFELPASRRSRQGSASHHRRLEARTTK